MKFDIFTRHWKRRVTGPAVNAHADRRCRPDLRGSLLRCVLLLTAGALPLDSVRAQMQAGAASSPLPVPDGSFLAGYHRDRLTTGTHDPLYAKALVLTEADQALALVSVDNIGLTRPDISRLQERAAKLVHAATSLRLAPARVIVSSTHTHSGPDVVGLWGTHLLDSGRDPALIATWIEAAAQQVLRASLQRVPVQLKAASSAMPQSWVQNVSEPGELDSTLSALAILNRKTGASIATVTNYACHPTVLGPGNTLVSADWVSGFYSAMAAQLPGEHLFLQGAIGGWVQPVQSQRTFAEAQGYGEELALETLALLETAVVEDSPSLDFASRELRFDLENLGFRLLMFLKIMERPLVDDGVVTSVAWFRIGRSQFATHPGETAPAFSARTRALMIGEPPAAKNTPTFVLGLTQDALGYILKPAYFEAGAPFANADYLTSVSLGPDTGPALMAALQALITNHTEADR